MINFVSLGQSCQTTHQISYFADHNPQSAALVKSPFDWLICPVESTTEWLKQGLRTFSIDEIVEHRGHAYWPRFNLWFWHGFFDRSADTPVLKIAEFAEPELSKHDYLRNKFLALDLSKTHFILSNTQNNLNTEVFEENERSSYWFDEENIDNLQLTLNHFYSDSVSLQVVTRPDRSSSNLIQRENVHTLPIDQSNWKGDKLAWGNLLQGLASGVSRPPLVGK
ncbi:MAG: hypothetical protein KTR32_40375 [Granulosicoccus sp.]|nr:hypothetical protein [Granulosicoccus sp.]